MVTKKSETETIIVYVKPDRAKPPFYKFEKKQKYTIVNMNKFMMAHPFEEYTQPVKVTVDYNPVLDE